jgi:hypothetical protein
MKIHPRETLRSLTVLLFVLTLGLPCWAAIPFDRVVVDDHGPKDPWAKIFADINGDGFVDICVGGRTGPLVWYAYPDWDKAEICPGGYDTVDGEAGDIDGDGDLDVVMGGLFWYENPGPSGDPAKDAWKVHKVADHPTHDVELGDLDGDGHLDIVTRNQSEFGAKAGNKIYLWYQKPDAPWSQKVIDCPHGEGIETYDLDLDGDLDIVIGGIWFENRLDTSWPAHPFGQWHPSATVQIGDINRDGRPDVVLSPSELKGSFYRLSWFQRPEDAKAPNWTEHVIADGVECVIHSLVTADVSGDGLVDVVSAEMHQGVDPDEVAVYVNQQKGAAWDKQVISTKGSHYVQVADVGSDGDLDIMGANWSGPYQPTELWINRIADAKTGAGR